ncbi:ABC transporter ATP-binding protein [Microbacterium sp. C448]|uniref:ABC transporter ATP-binding protein n=1 Tax=Microbacterium sp. C448 TaxID=1177594 RepID=UPI001A9F1BAA|nr:ABC transporter ATP-binding protein [Microbacterium sp. C448]
MSGVMHSFKTADGGQKIVLQDLNLVVPDGQFVCLVGETGCGKTTLLNMVAGLIEPTAGEISVFGKPPRQEAGDVAYMFARDALMPWRTASANVELAMEIRGIPRSERRKLAQNELERVGLGAYASYYPSQLSQGMRQRVALARTWAMDGQVLLMDEPFAALDAQTRWRLEQEFIALWQRVERPVMFVTHDLVEAVLVADRVIVMRKGVISLDLMVPFERPRTLDELTLDHRFHDLHTELRSALT